jgi:hypothetical protein
MHSFAVGALPSLGTEKASQAIERISVFRTSQQEGTFMSAYAMRDPTSETTPVRRARVAPPESLEGVTIALFDIGKARSSEFLDEVEKRLNARGLATRRYAKPTNAKVAPAEVIGRVAAETGAVLIALSD